MNKTEKSGSHRKRNWLIVLAVVLCSGAAGYIYKRNSVSSEITYREIKVRRGEITRSITATGTVQPENRLEVKPPIAGRIEQVLVKEGQEIKKGQILAWMSSTERAALIDAARAEGPAELKRWTEMYRATPVIAPIAGMLISRNVEPGQSFNANDAILVMSDRLTVKAQVDETDIAEIKLGQPAEIILDAYADKKFPAQVDQIAFEAKTVNNVTTYVVDVLPKEVGAVMRSGMTANVTFFVESKSDVVMVPAEAIKISDGRATVLMRDPSGKSQEHEVQVGITDGKHQEVVKGLNDGDVVLSAQMNLKGKSSGTNPFSPMGSGKKRSK